jgi:hypothetical protein
MEQNCFSVVHGIINLLNNDYIGIQTSNPPVKYDQFQILGCHQGLKSGLL